MASDIRVDRSIDRGITVNPLSKNLKYMGTRNKFTNKGIALFIAMALLLLLSVGAIVVLLTAYNYTNISENQIKRVQAITAAEAGIHRAYWSLRNDPLYTGETIKPDPNGPNVTITVTGPVSGRYTIRSRATY